MDHTYWEERLHGYMDKELAPADHTAMEQHIKTCAACQADLVYFLSMKRRLVAHREVVHMPEAVGQRIEANLRKQRRPWRRHAMMLGAVALAAMILTFILLPKEHDGLLIGKVGCHDCSLADFAELERGTLCDGNHRLGLEVNGALYRVVGDETGKSYAGKDLFGKLVEIDGVFMEKPGLVQLKSLKTIDGLRAYLLDFNRSRKDNASP